MKDLLKKINRFTIVLVSIAFILGILLHLNSFMIIICILIVFFIFGLYIFLYPKAYFIEPKSKDDYRLPWIALIASLFIMVVYTGGRNFDSNLFFILSIPFIIILSIAYIVKMIKTKKVDMKRSIFVFMGIIVISLIVTIPFNSLFPIIETKREKVNVLSKSYANVVDYEKNFSIYLKVGNSTKKFNVNKNKYKRLKESDYVLIEKQTNIFGMVFYEIV